VSQKWNRVFAVLFGRSCSQKLIVSWRYGDAGAKLSALDQFQREKEANEMERNELQEKLQQVQRQHADYVYETEKKRVIAMDKCVYIGLQSLLTSFHFIQATWPIQTQNRTYSCLFVCLFNYAFRK